MKLTPENIKTELQALTQGKKSVFKNNEGKVKIFFLKNGYYSITFDGYEIQSITDLEEVFETVLALLKSEND
ncbi:MAG: hypothetical protein U5N85_00440 [Arcicella sp.]|nr:hypothetical protein [Arcicella sp.]